ncbi:MAG: VOC family protein [Pseudomonadota bacterium]
MTAAHVSTDDIRAAFCAAMSDLYRAEVPLYGQLQDIVAVCDEERSLRAGDATPASMERHGAIRLGTRDELHGMRRVLAVMGLEPVGYYNLALSGVPVHSTAFRPTSPEALARSPFRLFTSLLRLELIEDEALRNEASRILARRRIFSDALLALVDLHEQQGGLTEVEARDFQREALETFRWHPDATVSSATYRALHAAHPLIADVVCFKGPHINHLTPCTRDIDAVQAEMRLRGMRIKEAIEGPPPRRHPILLRQTSFKALEEPVRFADDEPGAEGSHTARFGEVEQRGMALTHKGRALYDRLLALARDTSLASDADPDQSRRLEQAFRAFPDDLETLRARGLAYFRFRADNGVLHAEPLRYEDFLPVSAAGIFQSNLSHVAPTALPADDARGDFEDALGRPLIDEMTLYEREQADSLRAANAELSRRETVS